jgi:hypothetical protein
MPDNLIENYVDITKKYTDAPEMFLRAGGFFLISSLLGEFFSLPDVKVGRLNVWFILSSIPGRMRRSSVMNYANFVLKKTLIQYYVNQNKDNDKANHLYSLSQIEDCSPEGLCDAIIEGAKYNIMSFFITSTEFGDILKRISGGKHYSSGVDILLSKLYYGEGYNQQLSRRGGGEPRIIPSGTYVTMYSSIQEPHQYLTESMSRQGLLRRIMFLYMKTTDMTMEAWKEPFKQNYDNIWRELENYAYNHIVPARRRLFELTEQGKKPIPCRFVEDVKNRITEFAREADANVLNDASDYNIYRQTQWEYQVKLSALVVIAEAFAKDPSDLCNLDVKEIVVETRHYEQACAFIQSLDKHTENMMEEITLGSEQRRFREVLERIYKKIKDAGAAGINHSDLSRAFPKREHHLQEYIAVLEEEERIVSKQIPTKGRTKVVYYDASFA